MNQEVEFWREDIIKINRAVISEMKEKAAEHISKKFRYCFHENEAAEMQEMLFVNTKGQYLRPHMHKEAAETQIVVEGRLKVIIFNENGEIRNIFEASDRECSIYRIEKGNYHMVLPLTDTIVIYEVRQGNFTKHTNIFPEWAPENTDAVSQFYNNINEAIERME